MPLYPLLQRHLTPSHLPCWHSSGLHLFSRIYLQNVLVLLLILFKHKNKLR